MCAFAINADCAVACEHQASVANSRRLGEAWYGKAYSLYRQCLELLCQAQHCFDCSLLLQAITHHMAGCLHDLRDFQGVQDLLNAMFQRQVYELVSVAQVSVNAAAA